MTTSAQQHAPPPPAPARHPSPILRYFLPGLALGLIVGALFGAAIPTLVGGDRPPLRPVGVADEPTHPRMTREEQHAAEIAAEILRREAEAAEAVAAAAAAAAADPAEPPAPDDSVPAAANDPNP